MDELIGKLAAVVALFVVFGVVGWVFGVMSKAVSGKRRQQEAQDVRRHYEEQDAARARFQQTMLQRARSLFDALQIQNPGTSPLLHEPIYDCSFDQFELPCSHDSFADGYRNTAGKTGWFTDRESVMRALEGLVTVAQCQDYEYLAVVGDDASLAVITELEPSQPGGSVWRLIRTGANQWYAYSWKAGCRPSAASIDPPFSVKDILRDARYWREREINAAASRRANHHYQLALRRCRHRGVDSGDA